MAQITQKEFNDVVASLQKVMEKLEIEFNEVKGTSKEQREVFMKNVERIPEAKEGDIPDRVAEIYNSFVDEKLEDVVTWEEIKEEKKEKKVATKKKEIIKEDDPIPEKVIPKEIKSKKEKKEKVVGPKILKKEVKVKEEKKIDKKEIKIAPVVIPVKLTQETKKKEVVVSIPKEKKIRAKEKDLSVFGHRSNSIAGVLDNMFNTGITLKDAVHTLLEKFPKKNEYQVGERFFGYIRLLEKDKIIVETPKVEGGKYKVKK